VHGEVGCGGGGQEGACGGATESGLGGLARDVASAAAAKPVARDTREPMLFGFESHGLLGAARGVQSASGLSYRHRCLCLWESDTV
jgi:hypothetical protein